MRTNRRCAVFTVKTNRAPPRRSSHREDGPRHEAALQQVHRVRPHRIERRAAERVRRLLGVDARLEEDLGAEDVSDAWRLKFRSGSVGVGCWGRLASVRVGWGWEGQVGGR
jgi:hypothetical protein